MQEVVVALVFGFGLSSVALVCSVLGVLKDKYWLGILGAILFAPFSYYLFGASGANGFAFLPLLGMLLSAAAVHERNKLWAWVLLVPAFLVSLWVLAVALVYQIR
jgi:hypothetical protein